MAGERKRWWHVGFISGFFRGVAELVIRGGRTPANPYRRTDANPDGWYPDQFVTYQGMEEYMELAVPLLRDALAELQEIRRIQWNEHQVSLGDVGESAEPIDSVEITKPEISDGLI